MQPRSYRAVSCAATGQIQRLPQLLRLVVLGGEGKCAVEQGAGVLLLLGKALGDFGDEAGGDS